MRLVEIEPNRWRFVKDETPPARSDLPCPHIISDIMEAVEQVDGKYYSSKSAFRAVGRALGLEELGTEKIKPRQRASTRRVEKEKRRETLKLALDKYKAGYRYVPEPKS